MIVPTRPAGRALSASRATILALACAAALAACSGFAGTSAPTTLPAGLSAPMDQQGAQLDRIAALNLVNAYRSSVGVPPLQADSTLDAEAQRLADQYASSGRAPSAPASAQAMKLSAGYTSFAETFSGWRNSSADARVLADSGARRAGIAVTYNAGSTYGTHWVLLLAD